MKYKKILIQIEEDGNEILEHFAEYCRELHLPPMSFKVQCEMLLSLSEADMRQVVNDTIARGWKSVVYSIDNLHNKQKTYTYNSPNLYSNDFQAKEAVW